MSEPPAAEVVRWYTRARKFPQLIGRTPDGRRIPGGPYTFTQAVGAGVVLIVGVNTMGWWARYGLIGNGLLLLGVAYGAVLGLGRIPVGSRSPLAVASGGARALAAPRVGRLAGRPVRLRRPHRVRCRLVILSGPPNLPGRPAQPGILMTAVGAAARDTARYTPPDVVGRSPAKVGKVSVATPAAPAGDAGTTPPSRRRIPAGRPPRAVDRAGLMPMHRRRPPGSAATHPSTDVDVPTQPRATPGKGSTSAGRAGEARRMRAALPAEQGGQGSAPAAEPAELPRGSAAPPALSGVQLLLARAGAPEAGS